MESSENKQDDLRPLWLKNDNDIILGTVMEFHRNVESCHDANAQQKRNLACSVYENLKDIRNPDGTPLAFSPLNQDYDIIEAMVARKMLPDVVMLQGVQESAVVYDLECRHAFGLNLTDQINYYATVEDLADAYTLDVHQCILNKLDHLFGFERNVDGSYFSRVSDFHGDALQLHVMMNLPASVLCKYGVQMRRSAEALNLKLSNWFVGCSQSGFAILSGYTRTRETSQELLERVRNAAKMYLDVENECRNLFKSNPASLCSLVHNILDTIEQSRWVNENQMMMWLSLLWMAHSIGMMPALDMEIMKTRLMELSDLSLRQYVERYTKLTDDVGVIRAHALKTLVNDCRKQPFDNDLPF